eukprot:14646058-Alexandrium_andersonii.AAC.1
MNEFFIELADAVVEEDRLHVGAGLPLVLVLVRRQAAHRCGGCRPAHARDCAADQGDPVLAEDLLLQGR